MTTANTKNIQTQNFRKTEIKDFMENQLVDYASYSTLRAIASLADGAKNSGRKVIHTVQKKNITSKTKVTNLNSITSLETEYLHGDQVLNDVIVGYARNFVGTNNLNILYPSGNFGTRFEPEASAPRYIFTYKEKIFDKIFNKEDNNILIHQTFEGTDIEPRFFVPNLPLILLNGSEGIATGFAQKILPRKLETIKDYIKSSLVGDSVPELPPFYDGFNGVISAGTKPNQWNIEGVFVRKGLTKITITELPIGYSLASYTKVLDDLEDKKIIRSYKDKSNAKTDSFEFDVNMDSKILKQSDDVVKAKLKLIKTVTENFTVIDENNKVVVYDSPYKVIDHYIKLKLHFLGLRKNYLIQKTKDDLLILASKYLFIKNIVDGNITVNKVKKTDIIAQLKTYDKIITVDGTYDYLLKMPIHSLTEEKLEELLESTKNKKTELQEIQNKTIESTWEEEIDTI